ncbi:hypothetical protein [Ramlibacter rhizophilus]|uniref:Uncharacterized protein n=1 Tax=Ramlibacter rhizophilus TaxID=1781167 RepID=A0A4Z0C1X8_9BURK|nr:hypothetical protein [Ramlibacter rhizophilus]TFZ04229.1 hypothetical protein EZ242_00235 [Ramlibacter rhizophilus]
MKGRVSNFNRLFKESKMIKHSKLMGLMVGISAAATMGLASAQSVPPNADVANEAIGAGQQNMYGAPMGETGINEVAPLAPEVLLVPLAVVVPAEPVVAAAPQPTEVIVVTPPPAESQPVAQAPVMQPRQPEPIVAQAPVYRAPEPVITEPRMRADRN